MSSVIVIPDEVWQDQAVNLWEWVRPRLAMAIGDALARDPEDGDHDQ
jgi:hypothetical protein